MSRLTDVCHQGLSLEGLAVVRSSPLPIYAQIRQQLEQVLDARREARIETFFTDEEIARHFGVSRMTARQAVGEMVHDGLVYRRKGVGTFIAAPKITESEGPNAIGNFFEEWPTLGHSVTVELLVFEQQPCPRERASSLGIRPGEPVLRFVRRRFADNVPLVIDYRWVGPPLLGKLNREDLLQTSIHVLTAQHLGTSVGRSKYEIEAARCSRAQSDLLEMETGEPVLIRHVDVYAPNGDGLWTGESIYRADLYKYRIEIAPGQSIAQVSGLTMGVDL
ncbi:MAG: GntR family transcriptional regulator [Chloroflexi bacterium]|nr:GntR family transcriptional regulator [Chloroflexota bacterium]